MYKNKDRRTGRNSYLINLVFKKFTPDFTNPGFFIPGKTIFLRVMAGSDMIC